MSDHNLSIVTATLDRTNTTTFYNSFADPLHTLQVIGCCNKVSSSQLVSPAIRIPFMAVCEVHRQRLQLHQICPGCGQFCSQVSPSAPRWGKHVMLKNINMCCESNLFSFFLGGGGNRENFCSASHSWEAGCISSTGSAR